VSDPDLAYWRLIDSLLGEGEVVTTRNSKVRRVIGPKLTFASTPLVSLRRTAWRLALREMEFFLKGSGNLNDLHESARHWWRPWATPGGLLRGHYGEMFRRWGGGFDQVEYLAGGIRDHPYSRRNLITTWDTKVMASPDTPISTCHGTVIQAFVSPADNALHLLTYQRSADVIVGLGANLLQYWALLLWLAHRGGRGVGSLTWVGGDVHLYSEHEGLARRIHGLRPNVDLQAPPTPRLIYRPTSGEFLAADFGLEGEYRPAIDEKAEMIV
jgi:thymidylate synthase